MNDQRLPLAGTLSTGVVVYTRRCMQAALVCRGRIQATLGRAAFLAGHLAVIPNPGRRRLRPLTGPLVQMAMDYVVRGLKERDFDDVAAGMITHYCAQIASGIPLLPNSNETAKHHIHQKALYLFYEKPAARDFADARGGVVF